MKILVSERADGTATWTLKGNNNRVIARSPEHANVKAAQQSARAMQDSMLPPPTLTVKRRKINA